MHAVIEWYHDLLYCYMTGTNETSSILILIASGHVTSMPLVKFSVQVVLVWKYRPLNVPFVQAGVAKIETNHSRISFPPSISFCSALGKSHCCMQLHTLPR